MRKFNALEIIKFIVALITGCFLGFFLLEKGLSDGDLVKVILFFVMCVIAGFIIEKIGK